MNKVPPEGTDAGLKGANSSVGGCRPSEGSRVLAGEAGVCAGCDWRKGFKEEQQLKRQLGGIALKVFTRCNSQTACVLQLLTDGDVMSGGVDMSPKISNWLIF